MKRAESEVLVIGAGVIGLTSAICLAEAGLRVRVRTALSSHQTTSRVAGALWASSFAEPTTDVGRWASEGLRQFCALADRPDTGVRIARGTLSSRFSDEPPPPARFPGVQITPSNRVPHGFRGAFATELPLIHMPPYLDYLGERLAAAGVPIEVRSIGSLLEATEQTSTIVNCAGVGARELVPDPELRAVRGEHLVAQNPGVEDFFVEEPRSDEWISMFPHGERIVLGGNAREDDWNLRPDPAGAKAILDRCAQVEPRLIGARVIEQQVGLRPVRSVVRVEREQLADATIIHNYGHGASGVSLSWGCANAVVALALDASARR